MSRLPSSLIEQHRLVQKQRAEALEPTCEALWEALRAGDSPRRIRALFGEIPAGQAEDDHYPFCMFDTKPIRDKVAMALSVKMDRVPSLVELLVLNREVL